MAPKREAVTKVSETVAGRARGQRHPPVAGPIVHGGIRRSARIAENKRLDSNPGRTVSGRQPGTPFNWDAIQLPPPTRGRRQPQRATRAFVPARTPRTGPEQDNREHSTQAQTLAQSSPLSSARTISDPGSAVNQSTPHQSPAPSRSDIQRSIAPIIPASARATSQDSILAEEQRSRSNASGNASRAATPLLQNPESRVPSTRQQSAHSQASSFRPGSNDPQGTPVRAGQTAAQPSTQPPYCSSNRRSNSQGLSVVNNQERFGPPVLGGPFQTPPRPGPRSNARSGPPSPAVRDDVARSASAVLQPAARLPQWSSMEPTIRSGAHGYEWQPFNGDYSNEPGPEDPPFQFLPMTDPEDDDPGDLVSEHDSPERSLLDRLREAENAEPALDPDRNIVFVYEAGPEEDPDASEVVDSIETYDTRTFFSSASQQQDQVMQQQQEDGAAREPEVQVSQHSSQPRGQAHLQMPAMQTVYDGSSVRSRSSGNERYTITPEHSGRVPLPGTVSQQPYSAPSWPAQQRSSAPLQPTQHGSGSLEKWPRAQTIPRARGFRVPSASSSPPLPRAVSELRGSFNVHSVVQNPEVLPAASQDIHRSVSHPNRSGHFQVPDSSDDSRPPSSSGSGGVTAWWDELEDE